MVENTEYRLYTFGNFYMSSIQQGIQALHSTTELFIKYTNSSKYFKQRNDLFEWSESHKTVICLNGGMNSDLEKIKEMMENTENSYAWSYFNEAPEAMNGMLTNVAIILPNRIYETVANIRSKKQYFINNTLYETPDGYNICDLSKDTFSDFEIELINLLKMCSLAK